MLLRNYLLPRFIPSCMVCLKTTDFRPFPSWLMELNKLRILYGMETGLISVAFLTARLLLRQIYRSFLLLKNCRWNDLLWSLMTPPILGLPCFPKDEPSTFHFEKHCCGLRQRVSVRRMVGFYQFSESDSKVITCVSKILVKTCRPETASWKIKQ